jgi:uroporphyrinogen III methyltransferase/synthase
MPVARKTADRRPLAGWRVIVTREYGDQQLSPLLAKAGAIVLAIPAIETRSVSGGTPGLWERPGCYDWIVLSSENGVRYLFEKLRASRADLACLKGVRFACIGRQTADALQRHGIRSALTPRVYTQEGLAASFRRIPLRGKRILFARALEARDFLPKALSRQGADVGIWNLYRTGCPRASKRLALETFERKGGADILVFTSSLAAAHFIGFFNQDQRRRWLRGVPIASVGPVTSRTVRELGFQVAVQPETYTLPSLVRALVSWTRRRNALPGISRPERRKTSSAPQTL